ncbi:hypothetical protein ACHAWT_003861 [Skeletonema menzelii]
MSIPSKPIPIPRREDPNDEMMTTATREATELYDAATWRMFELITSARLRAASNFYCNVLVDDHSHHHTAAFEDHSAAASKSARQQQQQQIEGTPRRDRAYSLPEPPSAVPQPHRLSLMEEIFPMD